jgi:hypothetical protein
MICVGLKDARLSASHKNLLSKNTKDHHNKGVTNDVRGVYLIIPEWGSHTTHDMG